MRRVVVTGMGGVTPLGDSWESISAAIQAGRSRLTFPRLIAVSGEKRVCAQSPP